MKSWSTRTGWTIFSLLTGPYRCYMAKKESRELLVDTGAPFQYAALLRRIRQVCQPDSRPELLLLTHTHFDHAGNAFRLKQELGLRIAVHQKEELSMQRGFLDIPPGSSVHGKIVSSLARYIPSRLVSYSPADADLVLEEDGLLDYSEGLVVIQTPGHSTGSVSLVIDNEIALVGDTLSGIYPKSVMPAFVSDLPQLLLSWKKLLHTSCRLFLPGHGSAVDRSKLERCYHACTRE